MKRLFIFLALPAVFLAGKAYHSPIFSFLHLPTFGHNPTLHTQPLQGLKLYVFIEETSDRTAYYMPQIEQWQGQYVSKGLEVLAIFPNSGVSKEQISRFTDQYRLVYPIRLDRKHQLSNRFNVTQYPEVALTLHGKTIYKGKIDDAWGKTKRRKKVKNFYLRNILETYLRSENIGDNLASLR